MTSTFSCPSCGVSLDFPGHGETMRCPYCNTSIIIPEALQHATGEAEDAMGKEMPGLGQIVEQARELKDVVAQMKAGNDLMAIKLYRQITDCSLAEAKEAIDNLRAGKPVQWNNTTTRVQSQTISGSDTAIPAEQVAEMKRLLQMDKKIEAIKIYRKYTLSSLVDAKNAVEALGRGEGLPIAAKNPVENRRRALSCGSLASLLAVVIFVLSMLLVVLAVLPRDTQTALSDYVGRFGGGYGYITLRLVKPGAGPGMFGDARALTADTAGNIYVGDLNGGRIQVFNPDGKFMRLWNIEHPKANITGLEVDRQGVVYALYGNTIFRYDAATGKPSGKLTFSTQQGDDNFDGIRNIALAPDGRLVLTNGRDVLVITAKGEKVILLDRPLQKVADGTGDRISVAVDNDGAFYILDEANCMVYKFSVSGDYLTRFGGNGDQAGQFYYPLSIAVDSQNRVFVGDSNRIQAFDGNGQVLGDMWVDGVAYQMRFDGQNQLVAMVSGSNHILRYTMKK